MTVAARSSAFQVAGVPAVMGRALVVGLTYWLARVVADAAMQRLLGPEPFDLVSEAVAAAVVAVTLVVVADRMDGSRFQRAAALALLSFGSAVALLIEGSAFAPSWSPVGRLPLGFLLQLGVSVLTGAVAAAVVPGSPSARPAASWSFRAVRSAVWGGAVTYVIAYLLSGALMYTLITGPYYRAHASGLETPAPFVVIVVAALEGLLMALATVPVAWALPGSARTRGLIAGIALWALGGLAPLLQVSRLPDVIRVASAVEILFQKVPVGIVIARRFRR